LPVELARLQQDLTGDGWVVIRRDVSKSLSVPETKDIIRNIYEADPANTKGLFLFGHIAVAYSGNINPDEHEDDLGAWPADVYYADMDGEWTDTTVTQTNTYNVNIPGDGKFDQSEPPGVIHLQMGRVDLSNLTCFSNKNPPRYEVDLARQYLNKDHYFRNGQIDVARRGMIFDRFYRGLEKEPQTCAAWRTFPGFFGRDQVQPIGQDEYFPILSTNSYMWSYVVSGGSIYGSDYIGTSDAWALSEPKVVFTSFLGSWFGQWDRESDFLRAPLGTSGYTLTCIFSGQPQWILHPMGMGEPIGLAALLTQNNKPDGLYPPQINAGFGEVHIALMGDPSLRMHNFKPAANLTANANGNGVALSWDASPDPDLLGYYVYSSSSDAGPFTRISGSDPITTRSFTDPSGTANTHYMVRALKLEQTPAGTYYNLSEGVFYPDPLGQSSVPEAPRNLAISSIMPGSVYLNWISTSPYVRGFELQRRTLPDGTFAPIAQLDGQTSGYNDPTLSAGTYAYRVKALGFAGDSDFSGEASINLQPSSGAIVGVDRTTGGNWIGNYGDAGYFLVAAATNLPAYVTIGVSNVSTFVESWDTTSHTETLLRPDGKSRLQADWFNSFWSPMVLSFRFSDSFVHRVSIYMVDFGGNLRSGTMELIDPFRGRLLASQYFTNFGSGQYITMDIRNPVDVRMRPDAIQYNVVLSGIFFTDPGPLAAPLVTPSSGSFPGKTAVNMTGPDGAKIYYTTDGSEPNTNSLLFGGPFVLTTSATIRAISMRDGYPSSAITTVSLTNTLHTTISFLAIDSTTQGNWPGKYGATGGMIAAGISNLPQNTQFDASRNQVWTWNDTTTDSRALIRNSGDPMHIASAWYDPNQLQFDASIYSDTPQQISLYFLDWDNSGRIEDLTISDAAGSPLLTRRIDNFAGGEYVIFNGRGFFQIKIQNIAGPNAALSGIFIDPAAQQINTIPPLIDPPAAGISSGGYSIRINGQSGQVFDVQTSDDLKTWTTIGQASLSQNSSDFNIPFTPDTRVKFFRAVLQQ
jgi:hypothetical protein